MSDRKAASAEFRRLSDRHAEETGEGFYSGVDCPDGKNIRGYYFSFGYFTNPAEAMVKVQELREAVPHIKLASGTRQCPEPYCICAPHPGNQHCDATGATWRTRSNGSSYDVFGHDGE